MKRGQISTEYLIIASFIIFLIIGVLGVSWFYTGQVKSQININQLRNFANKVISSSEAIFFSGSPSKSTMTAYLPSGVKNIQILDKEIVFEYYTSSGFSKTSFQSDVSLVGNLSSSEGVKRISIVAETDKVRISEG